MTIVAQVTCVTLFFLAFIQFVPALAFVFALRRAKPLLPSDEACPRAAVLLSVRGDDPFLTKCVEGLLQQDYPAYTVRIVVDHIEDPAWKVIDRVVKRFPGRSVQVEPLHERFGTCTLKVNSLIQAVSDLDESFIVVAILDADVIPHSTWLRELVAPFQNESVLATTGNRWYIPAKATIATLVRYAWNAGAAVQMYFGRCTWGGSMAFRAQLFHDTHLKERWRHAIASDTALDEVIKSVGGKVVFVPSLMILNRESCTLGSVWRFVQRQLLHSRLKGVDWPYIFMHGMCMTFVQLIAICLFVIALADRDWYNATMTGVSLAANGFVMLALLGLMEFSVRKVAYHRGEPMQWLTPKTFFKLILAVPLTQILYAAVLPTVRFLQVVTWRGVEYRIEGRNVTLIRYEPFTRNGRTANESNSL